MKLLICLSLTAAGLPLSGQAWYPKHNITVGGAFAQPSGDIEAGMGNAGALTVGYGYRFFPNLQADIGLDTAFHAAGVKDYLYTGYGYQRIHDYEFFVPFGGRAILPIGRFWISGGAGGAYLRYSELLHQPSQYYRFDCPVCTSRSGWGWYALAAVGGVLDRGGHFRLSVTAKMYRAHTDGETIQGIPPIETKDKWLIIGPEFGFSF
jgi:hypothetical protein